MVRASRSPSPRPSPTRSGSSWPIA